MGKSDRTGWMGGYSPTRVATASIMRRAGRPTDDLIVKFLGQFALIADALRTQDLWDDEDGFFYDRLRRPDGSSDSVKVRSIVGILPLLAVAVVDRLAVERAYTVNKHGAALLAQRQAEIDRLKEDGV